MSALEQSAVNPYKAPRLEQITTPKHPLHEGVFNMVDPSLGENELPARLSSFTHEVCLLEPVADTTFFKGAGEVTRYRVRLEDESEHLVDIGEPSQQISPVAEVSTTAYTTGLDGFNLHHLLRSMKQGFPVIKISAERHWQGELSQARTAYNMLKIAQVFEEENPNVISNKSVLTGVSRAAMIALGMRALAASQSHEIPYMNLIAPCYPRPATIGLPTLLQPGKEIISLGRHLTTLPLRLLVKYPSSIDISPEGLRYHPRAIPMLTSGEAGTFKDYIPRDARGFMTTYNDDLMGMGRVWQEDYENHPFIEVVDGSGKGWLALNNHLRCISYGDLMLFSARQARLGKELGQHSVAANIDIEAIAA